MFLVSLIFIGTAFAVYRIEPTDINDCWPELEVISIFNIRQFVLL